MLKNLKTFQQIKNRFAASEQFVREFDKSNSGKMVLDAGAGEQRAKCFIQKNKYISQDFGEYKGGGAI